MGTLLLKISKIKDADKLLLIFIYGLALFLRLYRISDTPPSLNWDEISHGFNAYSVLKTGSDEWGNIPILNFRAYGDYPLPLNLYLTTPFVGFLGLSELSIRLPHAIMGSLLVFSVYFLTLGLTKKRGVSLMTSFLTAITPWYVFPSRFVVQSNLSVLFLTTSLALFFNREKQRYFLPLSLVSLTLTLFSYHTTRILSPLVLIVIVVLFYEQISDQLKKNKYILTLSMALLMVFILCFFVILINSQTKARSKWVFLINEGSIGQIIEKRNTSNLPVFITRLLYNRPVFFITQFSKNYLGYFSPGFLFLKGGTNYQLSLPGKGLIYPVNLPFFYIGLIAVIYLAVKRKKEYLFIFLYLILAPIPAAITTEKFAVIRSTTMLPFTEIVTALGVLWSVNKIVSIIRFRQSSVIFFAIYFVLIGFCFAKYTNAYFGNYPLKYSWVWQYGYKQVVDFTKENYSKYDKIIITKKYGEPHEYFLFFWPWDPEIFKSDPDLIRYFKSDWYWVDRFDKFYFVNDWDIPVEEWQPFILESKKEEVDCRTIKCLLITSPGNVPKTWKKLKTVDFLDGNPAFEIYEN